MIVNLDITPSCPTVNKMKNLATGWAHFEERETKIKTKN